MNISKHIFILLAALFSFSAAFAQDNKGKERKPKQEFKISSTIKTVKGLLKETKYQNANDEINKAQKEHSEAKSSSYLYHLKTQALYNLVLAENKKIYLNQKPDTTKYFSYIYDLYKSALVCDSLDNLPNEKGKVNVKFRSSNQQKLVQFRKNLSTADKFFFQKKDYKKAYDYADLYLSSKKEPIFITEKGVNLIEGENDTTAHGSLALFLAYSNNNKGGVVKYLPLALNDTSKLAQVLEVGASTYYELGDTLAAHELLNRGVKEFPTIEYFYMTLVKYYNGKSEYDKALKLINFVLKSMPENRNCLFLKAKEHEYLGQYDQSIETFKKIIALNHDDYEVHSALASIYLQQAHDSYDGFKLKVTDSGYSKGREIINDYYRKAKTAFELCKKLAEKNTELWLVGLRECYYKLNMGKELKMLESTIK